MDATPEDKARIRAELIAKLRGFPGEMALNEGIALTIRSSWAWQEDSDSLIAVTAERDNLLRILERVRDEHHLRNGQHPDVAFDNITEILAEHFG